MGDRIDHWFKYCFEKWKCAWLWWSGLQSKQLFVFLPCKNVCGMKWGSCLCIFTVVEARMNESFCRCSVIASWPESFYWKRESAFKTFILPHCNTVWLSRAIFRTSLIIIPLYFKPQNRSLLVQVWELDLVLLSLASKQVPSLRKGNVLTLQAEVF